MKGGTPDMGAGPCAGGCPGTRGHWGTRQPPPTGCQQQPHSPAVTAEKVSGWYPMSLGTRSPRVENPGDNHQAAGTHLAEDTGQISPSPAEWPLAQSLPSSGKDSGLSQATTPLPKAFVNSTFIPTRWDLMTQTQGSQRRRCPSWDLPSWVPGPRGPTGGGSQPRGPWPRALL